MSSKIIDLGNVMGAKGDTGATGASISDIKKNTSTSTGSVDYYNVELDDGRVIENAFSVTNGSGVVNSVNTGEFSLTNGVLNLSSSETAKINGKIDAPSNPSADQVLTYNGSEWVAEDTQSVPQLVMTSEEWEVYDKSEIEDDTVVVIKENDDTSIFVDTDDFDVSSGKMKLSNQVHTKLVNKFTKAEWSALSESEKKSYDGKLVAITDDQNSNICSTVASCVASTSGEDVCGASALVDANTYSITEKVIGKWIDGKPIYRKCLSGRISTYTDSTTRRLFKTNLIENVDEICRYGGWYTRSGESTSKFALPSALAYMDMTISLCSFVMVANNIANISIVSNKSFGDTYAEYKVYVEYTKTTD